MGIALIASKFEIKGKKYKWSSQHLHGWRIDVLAKSIGLLLMKQWQQQFSKIWKSNYCTKKNKKNSSNMKIKNFGINIKRGGMLTTCRRYQCEDLIGLINFWSSNGQNNINLNIKS
jgi:hypothetical protein